MTNEKKQVEVKEGFRVSSSIGSDHEIRNGWSGSFSEYITREQLEDCFDDAMRHSLWYAGLEFYVENTNEIRLFLTFASNPERGRISVKRLLKDRTLFEDFFVGVMGFVDNDLRPINADTSLAMKLLYGGVKFNELELHHKATDLAMRLEEIARSWIEFLKESATYEDLQRIEDNSTLETCEMTRWGKIVEEIINLKNA